MGLESIDVDHFQVGLVARTPPGTQFEVGRMLQVRIAGNSGEGINTTVLQTQSLPGPPLR